MRRVMPCDRKVLNRRSASVFVAAAVLAGAMGLECDQDARAVFRQEATPAIGEGVKTIVNGVLDGWIDAVIEAGDGPSE